MKISPYINYLIQMIPTNIKIVFSLLVVFILILFIAYISSFLQYKFNMFKFDKSKTGLISKLFNEYFIKCIYNKIGLIKSIFLVSSLLLFLATIIFPILGLESLFNSLLAFMSSYLFSWILTEYSSNIELAQTQRNLSIIYFRNCRSVVSKIDERIDCIDNQLDIFNSNLSENITCKTCSCLSYIDEVKQHLESFKSDIIQIQNNISDTICEDIVNYYRLEEIEYQIFTINSSQGEESKVNSACSKHLSDLESEKEDLSSKLDIRIKLLFDDEIRNAYEKREKKANKDRENYMKSKPQVKDFNIDTKDAFNNKCTLNSKSN